MAKSCVKKAERYSILLQDFSEPLNGTIHHGPRETGALGFALSCDHTPLIPVFPGDIFFQISSGRPASHDSWGGRSVLRIAGPAWRVRWGASAMQNPERPGGLPPLWRNTPRLSTSKICLMGYFIPKKPPSQQKTRELPGCRAARQEKLVCPSLSCQLS